jgi:hypothetical protein
MIYMPVIRKVVKHGNSLGIHFPGGWGFEEGDNVEIKKTGKNRFSVIKVKMVIDD